MSDKIEVYGIPEELYPCYACVNTTRYLDMKGKQYTFIPVLFGADNSLGFDYNRDKIKELVKRAKFSSLAISYPQIFINGIHIGGFKDLKKLYS